MPSMHFLPTVDKTRKPKFELHLKIHDLNNVPLVSGNSLIKWHLSGSIHADHRGRTSKCPIANHRVDYAYSKTVTGVRIPIDKTGNLSECPLEFEILQEFSLGSGRDEKITLGSVKLNLSEYVEESAELVRDGRKKPGGAAEAEGEEGIVRRYLMQESKINSTLKIGILMVQIDGERNYVAPPLKTAPVFGGIAGIMAGEQVDQDDAGQLPTISKSRDASELQDLYRRSLAASWSSHPSELPADLCIEDIFAGGSGWAAPSSQHSHARRLSQSQSQSLAHPHTHSHSHSHSRSHSHTHTHSHSHSHSRLQRLSRGNTPTPLDEDDSSISDSDIPITRTLRPSDFRLLHLHQREFSSESTKSTGTIRGIGPSVNKRSTLDEMVAMAAPGSPAPLEGLGELGLSPDRHRRETRRRRRSSAHRRTGSREEEMLQRDRSDSLTSLAPTMGSSDRGRRDVGFKRAREVDECEVRDDMVAWRLPDGVA